MTYKPHMLENRYWQAGILPETGASIAYGGVWNGSAWVDILRPTAPADYGNSSACSSFIMLPWCNRIGGGRLGFGGVSHQLAVTRDDGTARHGDVRGRAFAVTEASATAISMTLDSRTQEHVNWPFAFRADVTYRLDGAAFVWDLALTNLDTRPFPAGFGHHPYFVRPARAPIVQVPCAEQFELENFLAVNAPVPIVPRLDFRQPRALPDGELNDLLTAPTPGEPVRLTFADRAVSVVFSADPIFAHWLIYAPLGKPFFAVEPMTNASNGFALDEADIRGSGVFVLAPGETRSGTCCLTVA